MLANLFDQTFKFSDKAIFREGFTEFFQIDFIIHFSFEIYFQNSQLENISKGIISRNLTTLVRFRVLFFYFSRIEFIIVWRISDSKKTLLSIRMLEIIFPKYFHFCGPIPTAKRNLSEFHSVTNFLVLLMVKFNSLEFIRRVYLPKFH